MKLVMLKRWSLPVILIAVHAIMMACTGIAVWTSRNPEAEEGWQILFAIIDWPGATVLFFLGIEGSSLVFMILVLGSIQWGLVGIGLQAFLRWCLRNR